MNQEQVRAEQNFEGTASKDEILIAPAQDTGERLVHSGLEVGKDYLERATESAGRIADASGLPAVLPPPVVDDTTLTSDDITSTGVDLAIAADDDLIEKEWVGRAKKIVEETKSDPYAQEIAVYSMQEDYKQKRGLDRAQGQ